MANDVICLLTIGDGSGMLKQGGKDPRVFTADGLHISIAVKQFSPLLYYLSLLLSPISPTLDGIFLIGKQLHRYGIKGVQAVRFKSNTGAGRTFFALALEDFKADNANVANARAELTDAEICVDAAGFQLAGSDTVAITLTFLVWCVLGRPALQKQLKEEVAGTVSEVTDAACEQMPLLNAVIDETLRLHGAAPTALRRVTPRGGATLGGYRIPEATIVTTQAWSLHRNPDVLEGSRDVSIPFRSTKPSLLLSHPDSSQLRSFPLAVRCSVGRQRTGYLYSLWRRSSRLRGHLPRPYGASDRGSDVFQGMSGGQTESVGYSGEHGRCRSLQHPPGWSSLRDHFVGVVENPPSVELWREL